jgi:AcrR family transcriptional regulator
MTAVGETRPAGAGRARLHEAALRLFAEHGVSGTSLQMIADELGVTKAAVYWHYKTKDEIVLGVVTPFVEQLAQLVENAKAVRGRRAQVETALTGLVDVIVSARRVYVVIASDPTYGQLQERHPRLHQIGEDLLGVLAGPDPDEETRVTVSLFLVGLTGPLHAPFCASIGDEELRRVLLDLGRRLLSRRSARA